MKIACYFIVFSSYFYVMYNLFAKIYLLFIYHVEVITFSAIFVLFLKILL